MPSALILGGFFLIITMQIAIFFVAVKNSPGKAALCLVIPLFVYVYAQKEPRAKPFLWAWYGGVFMLVAGGIAAS